MSKESVPPERFRTIMANVPVPVSIVTAFHEQKPYGATVSSFTSLSLDPPMVLVSLGKERTLLEIIKQTNHFGLNILSSDQVDTAKLFGRRTETPFDQINWSLDSNLPKITNSPGWLVCECSNIFPGGDHEIVLGRVVMANFNDAEFMVHHMRKFCRTIPLDTQ